MRVLIKNFVMAVLLIAIFMLSSNAFAVEDNHQQKGQEAKKISLPHKNGETITADKVDKNEKFNPCKEVIVEFSNHTRTVVPKGVYGASGTVYGFHVMLENGKLFELKREQIDSCEVIIIKDANGVSIIRKGDTFNYGVTREVPRTEYKIVIGKINQTRKDGKSKFLKDNIERINTPYLYFILPQDKAPTKNDEPVVIGCPPTMGKFSYCSTRYIHPSGLSVSYMVSRKNYGDEEILTLDQDQRRYLEVMIEKAKTFKE